MTGLSINDISTKLINGTNIMNPTKTHMQLGHDTKKPLGAAKSDMYMNWNMITYITQPTTRLFDIIRNIFPDRNAFPKLKPPEKIERIISADPRMKVGLETA